MNIESTAMTSLSPSTNHSASLGTASNISANTGANQQEAHKTENNLAAKTAQTRQQPLKETLQQNKTENKAVNGTEVAINKQADKELTAKEFAEELNDAVDEINNTLYSMNKAVKFEINDKTDDLVVRVINTDTDQVIRQYPSEEVLQRKERLLEGDTSAFSARVD